jgi:hypothetical protein
MVVREYVAIWADDDARAETELALIGGAEVVTEEATKEWVVVEWMR